MIRKNKKGKAVIETAEREKEFFFRSKFGLFLIKLRHFRWRNELELSERDLPEMGAILKYSLPPSGGEAPGGT